MMLVMIAEEIATKKSQEMVAVLAAALVLVIMLAFMRQVSTEVK